MTTVPSDLAIALRRVRLQAALALAQQQPGLAEVVPRLTAELGHVIAEEDRVRHGSRLGKLVRRLDLRPIDELALIAAAALELDPLFATTASALFGSEPRQGMTSRLLGLVLLYAGDEALELQIDSDHPLVRAGALERRGDPTTPASLGPWGPSARTLSYLCGSDALDPALARCGSVLALPRVLDFSHAQAAWTLIERALLDDEPVAICIEGITGVGRRSLAAAVAAAHGKTIVSLDASRASTDLVAFRSEVRALKHECWLRGALPLVAGVDVLGPRASELATLLEGDLLPGPKFLTAAAGTSLPALDVRVLRTRVDMPNQQASLEIWRRALGDTVEAGHTVGALAEIVNQYTLTPGSIERSAANARLLAGGRDIVDADIRAGVSAEVQERFGDLATRVVVSQTWDDLVLPPDTLDDIKAFVSRASHMAMVYEQWGFRTKLQRGLGLAALFSGPPGTGKTMVAGLIANNLGLDLYQVDLSQVVSKWVGETEKALGRIFDAAEMGHALLLFDEADSLFSKRTEVTSSNDRYANLEVNYLLQRIESFGGVAILTTNLDSGVDPAFKRRLAVDIPFYPPDLEERERLWRTMLPAAAPRDENLEFDELARQFDKLCGGNIRNAVLRGAFLAAAEQKPISQDHLMRAGRAEYRAMGKVGA